MTAENVLPVPDPSILTTQQLRHELLGVESEIDLRHKSNSREQNFLQELIEVKLDGINALSKERVANYLRESSIRETHRLELKADNQKSVETAMVAAEKAVQAALAAAEKARDQQTIASQLATTKAEDASKERQDKQGETFTLGISVLNIAVNEVKGMLGEVRAKERGGQEQTTERRATNSQTIAIAAVFVALFGGAVTAALIKAFGG